MTVQDAVRSVPVPQQRRTVDPGGAARPATTQADVPSPVRLLGRDRPLTPDERLFLVACPAMFGVLATIIVTFLLLSEHVWG